MWSSRRQLAADMISSPLPKSKLIFIKDRRDIVGSNINAQQSAGWRHEVISMLLIHTQQELISDRTLFGTMEENKSLS
jgi:hypothetical protein